MAFLNSFTHIK